MSYEDLWQKLRADLAHFADHGVQTIHPIVTIFYMDRMVQEHKNAEQANEATRRLNEEQEQR